MWEPGAAALCRRRKSSKSILTPLHDIHGQAAERAACRVSTYSELHASQVQPIARSAWPTPLGPGVRASGRAAAADCESNPKHGIKDFEGPEQRGLLDRRDRVDCLTSQHARKRPTRQKRMGAWSMQSRAPEERAP